MKTMRETIRDLKIRRQTHLSLQDIAQRLLLRRPFRFHLAILP
jgi:hypothetical protein